MPTDTSSPVLIVMAVFRPDPDYLSAQMRSLAQQSHTNLRLIAVIADKVSRDLAERTAREAGLTGSVILPCDTELDSVRAFEAGLWEAQRIADTMLEEPLIALCDQDDIWHPDRLAEGVEALTGSTAQLVHSDARLVGSDGTTQIQRSMFAFERRHRNPGLRGLLYRNNITGMTILMRPQVMRLALPFPAQSGVHFYHDLWLGLIAAATGGVTLIDKPLVDYRQHGNNAIGAVDRQKGWLCGCQRRRPDAMWLRREAASYALARYLAQSLHARLTDAVTGGVLTRDSIWVAPLRPYLRRLCGIGGHLWDAGRLTVTGHLRLARIAAGFGIVNAGRLVWTLREALGAGLNKALGDFDARLYSLSPGVAPERSSDSASPQQKPTEHDSLTDSRKRPRWRPDFSAAQPAITILVPTLNPTEIFAGIVTAVDIGLGLAAQGHRLRFIATDLPVSSQAASHNFLLQRLDATAAASGASQRIQLYCGVQNDTIPAHRDDIFLATAWWSAHIADYLIRSAGYAQKPFYYLIQDYEPNFYAWGGEFADALASYDFNFVPIFNTSLLRDYFSSLGYGFAHSNALTFHPSIDLARYADRTRPERAPGAPRRLALYGRPEVARNMYPTAIEALSRFLDTEALGPDQIELVSVGLAHAPVNLPRGHQLCSLGKLPWSAYPDYLLGTDLGLSLMYSPHPSHPPLEMAASGVRVVTNRFGPKDLGKLSPAILSAAPNAPDLAAALSRAWTMPAVSSRERQINLAALGQPLGGVLQELDQQLIHQTLKEPA